MKTRRTLVGIDHGFSFPIAYFERHGVSRDWSEFLDDFQRHWPTDEDSVYVDFVREGVIGNGAARPGNTRWRRIAEIGARRAKSVFHFDVPGSVAKSTHAGLPWLRMMRRLTNGRTHFWPFDGWTPDPTRSVIAEVYPALWSGRFERGGRTPDQHDAYSIAMSLYQADSEGSLTSWFDPVLTARDRETAAVEGWILGVS